MLLVFYHRIAGRISWLALPHKQQLPQFENGQNLLYQFALIVGIKAGKRCGEQANFGMGRKRTKLTLSATETTQLKTQIRATTDPRDKERLQVVSWATSGQHTLADLARLAGRARSTIQVWLDDFTEGGTAQLLEREAPPGKPSPVAGAKVQAQFQAGLQAGQWRTAGQVAAWLKETHGIQRAAKSLYYWLGNSGRRAPGSASLPRQTEPGRRRRLPRRT